MLVRIHRAKGLTSPELGRAIAEWHKPTNDYGRNVYTLFNACTEALKPTGRTANMETFRQRSMVVSEVMDEAA